MPRWGAVICAKTAHIHADEGGAPEKVAGIKLLPVRAEDGKLTPVLDRTYPMADTTEALRYVEGGHAHGKVVITVA